jgi:hypothetical protein
MFALSPFPISNLACSNDLSAGCYSNVNFIVSYGQHVACTDLYNEIKADSDSPLSGSH